MKVFPWRSSPSVQAASWQSRAQQLYSPVSAPVEFTSCNRLCWLKCLILKDRRWGQERGWLGTLSGSIGLVDSPPQLSSLNHPAPLPQWSWLGLSWPHPPFLIGSPIPHATSHWIIYPPLTMPTQGKRDPQTPLRSLAFRWPLVQGSNCPLSASTC